MSLQLFLVPPKQLDEWDDEFEKEFSKWKCRESNINSNYNKSDYRQYIINLNFEYNLDKIYDNLEMGLEAFKKLRELITRFPQYKLNDNLEKLYSDSENVKDFITWGAEFVGSLDSDTVDLAIDCPNEPVGQPTNIDNEVAGSEPDGQLGYSDKKAPDVEARIVECSSEPEEQSAEDVSKDNDEVVDTPVTKKGKSSNSSRKAKRRKRLLKYQQKLVDTRGLPPSRLMQQTPELSSGLENPNLRKRNLLDSFAEYDDATGPNHPVPVVPLPVGTPQAAVHPEMIGQVNQPLVGVYGTSSTQSKLPMLCSISPPWASGLGTGPVGGWSTGWPEARPMMGLNFNMPQSSYVYCGGNSTSMNQTSLSPSSQYMPGCQEGMPQPPYTPGGSPAFCYHCLQYGAVYTINLV